MVLQKKRKSKVIWKESWLLLAFKSTAAHRMSSRPADLEHYKMKVFSDRTPKCEKGILETHRKKRSVGSMEKFVNITQGKGHRTIYQFGFCCFVRAQMCRTDNTFSLWLMRPGHSESQICKARGIHPQMWNGLPENKLPKNWLAPTKNCVLDDSQIKQTNSQPAWLQVLVADRMVSRAVNRYINKISGNLFVSTTFPSRLWLCMSAFKLINSAC